MYTKKDIIKASNLNSSMLLFFLGAVTLASLAFDPVTRLFTEKDSQYYNSVYNLVAYTLQYFIGMGGALIIFYCTKTGKEVKKERPLLAKPQMPASWIFRHIMICFFITYSTVYISNFIFVILEQIIGIKLYAPDFTAEDNIISKLANVLGLMFLAPVFEETFFRGSMLRSNLRFGKWSMIVTAGIFFGLWHMNYAQTLYTMAMGIYAGFIYAKTKSLIPTLIIHFVFNTIGTIQSIVVGNVDLDNLNLSEDIMKLIPIELLGFLIIALILTGLILFILELVNHRDSYKLDDEPVQTEYASDTFQPANKMSEGKVLAIYFSAPVTIITTIILLGSTIAFAFGVDA